MIKDSKFTPRGTQSKTMTKENMLDSQWAVKYTKDVDKAFWNDILDSSGSSNETSFLNKTTLPILGDQSLINDKTQEEESVDGTLWVMIPENKYHIGGWYWYYSTSTEDRLKKGSENKELKITSTLSITREQFEDILREYLGIVGENAINVKFKETGSVDKGNYKQELTSIDVIWSSVHLAI